MATGSITNIDGRSSPVLITSVGHGLSTSNVITISGATGSLAYANGTYVITVLTADTFTLDGSIGSGISGIPASATWATVTVPTGITSATNASPIVITAASHGLSTGNFVQIGGVVGNEAANGRFAVTVVNANSFSLDGSVGSGSYVSGGEFSVVTVGVVTGATNADPIVITSANHGLSTGDAVVMSGVQGNAAANISDQMPAFPVTVIDANSFSLTSVAGSAAYVSGGVFYKQLSAPAIPTGASEPLPISTATSTTGTGDFVLASSQSSAAPNGSLVDYSISIGSLQVEIGQGFYTAASNSISRNAVAFNGGDNVSHVSLPSGNKAVTFSFVGGGLPPVLGPGDLPEVNANIRALLQAMNVSTSPQETFYLMGELLNALAERRAIITRGGGPVGGNAIRPSVLTGMFPSIISLPSALARPLGPGRPAFPPLRGGLGAPLPGAIAIVSLVVLAGVVIARNLRTQNNYVVQGMLSPLASSVGTDADRIGISNVVSLVPTTAAAASAEDAKITLYAVGSTSGWRDFLIVNGGNVPSINLRNQPSLPFRVDPTKIDVSTAALAGLPCDVFAYVPANAGPNPVPQLFFLNWKTPYCRNSNPLLADGTQSGFRLNLDSSQNVTLKIEGESWAALETTNRKNDRAYLYMGTVVPIADGMAICAPNFRLMINQFNRLAYSDSFTDQTASWTISPSFYADSTTYDDNQERMNPSRQGSSWRHYSVNPMDYNSSALRTPLTIPSTDDDLTAGGYSGDTFGMFAWAVGRVKTAMFRREVGTLITNATDATPIVITCPGHGLVTGAVASIDLVRGNTAANGTRTVTVTDANTFSLNGSVGNAAYTSGTGILISSPGVRMFPVATKAVDRPGRIEIPVAVQAKAQGGRGNRVPGLNLVEVYQGLDPDRPPGRTGPEMRNCAFFGASVSVTTDADGLCTAVPGAEYPISPRTCGLVVTGRC